jgi:hypothetical protein
MAQATLTTVGGDLFTVGKPGQRADLQNSRIVTRQNGQVATLDFGVAAFWDTGDADGSCRVQNSATDLFVGLTVAEPLMVASSDGLDTVNYAQYANVPLLVEGPLYVQVAENVLAQDAVVAIRAGGGGNSAAGALGSQVTGATSATRLLVPGAVWLTTTLSGNIGKVLITTVGNARAS